MLTVSVDQTLDAGSAKITVTVDAGDNTIDLNNSAPSVDLTNLVFSELGNNTTGYKIYKEGDSANQGTISNVGVLTIVAV